VIISVAATGVLIVSSYWQLRYTILQVSKDADMAVAERDLKAANAAAERDLKAANAAAERDLKAANAAAERDLKAAMLTRDVTDIKSNVAKLSSDVAKLSLDVAKLLQRADSKTQEASTSTTGEPRAPKPQPAEPMQANTASPASAPLGGVSLSSALATCHVGSAGLLSGARPLIRLPGAPSARLFQRGLLIAVRLWK
jgi:hypothetical protein